MSDPAVRPNQRLISRKGLIIICAIAAVLIGYFTWRDFRWYSSHTTATDEERSKIAALLNLTSGQTIRLKKYEFQYHPYWMDKFGSTAAMITRTSNSPPWSDMLKHWHKLDEMPDDFARVKILPWAAERLDQSGPFYYRWVNTSYARKTDDREIIKAFTLPQLCAAYFDKEKSDTLYLCTEGDLMWPDVTISPNETTGTLDWSLPAWHSI